MGAEYLYYVDSLIFWPI